MPPPPPPHAAASPAGPVVFFHPDLGIGGAERLVVDAAVGLQSLGHNVVIFTSHCDPSHCFDECRDGTLDVRVHGDWLPMSILNRLTILCAIARHIYLLLRIHLSSELRRLSPAVFVVDQLSAGLPLLRLLAPHTPILFYCHFPDLLLVQGRQASLLKRLYRVPFDRLEQWSMTFSHAVAVNSRFTRGVVERTWPRLSDAVETKVVYPCVDVSEGGGDDQHEEEKTKDEAGKSVDPWEDDLFGGESGKMILSINRFERKKNIDLAITAFAAIPEHQRRGVRLILAGGYDPRVSENVQYHTDLQHLASSLSLTHHTLTPSSPSSSSSVPPSISVLFLLSIPNSLKATLLQHSTLLLYTPSNEHFGIVPLEAMLARLPVLACNTGGPVETIRDGATGWLRDPDDVPAWTAVIQDVLRMPGHELRAIGAEGARRVRTTFGRDKLALRLQDIMREIAGRAGAQSSPVVPLGSALLVLGFALAVYYFLVVR